MAEDGLGNGAQRNLVIYPSAKTWAGVNPRNFAATNPHNVSKKGKAAGRGRKWVTRGTQRIGLMSWERSGFEYLNN